MKIKAKYYAVYAYKELKPEAKEKAKWDYISAARTPEELRELYREDLKLHFGEYAKDLAVSYSLNQNPNDFAAVEGMLPANAFMRTMAEKYPLDEKSLKALEMIAEGLDVTLSFAYKPENACDIDTILDDIDYQIRDVANDVEIMNALLTKHADERNLTESVKNAAQKNMQEIADTLQKAREWLCTFAPKYVAEINQGLKEMGLAHFYEISDEEMEEVSELMGYEYDKDGNLL